MKILFSLLLVLSVSVSALGAQQKFSSLPIGANLDGYISSIQLYIGTDGNYQEESFRYNRQYDGSLETFAAAKLREVTSRFVPKAGQASALHGWGIDAITEGVGNLLPSYNGESEPAVIAVAPLPDERATAKFRFVFRNNRWEVPEEVFGKVKFQFGWGIGYYIPGVADLEVNLYSGSRISRFSTREKIQEEGNPCELPAITLALPDVVIPREIATAQSSWWEYAEITLLTDDNRSVTFLVNRTERDGTAIRWSNPPPSFFTPPSPKITSLKRVGDITEIGVENPGAVGAFEFSTDLREWREVSGTEIVLKSTDPSGFRHRHKGETGFYRLRQKDGTQ